LKGYVQVYTGKGKGKTTAALGLALRAAGAGFRVFIAQFVKGMRYSELDALERFSDRITLKQYGRDCFIYQEPTEEDIRVAREGLKEAKEIIVSGSYSLVILDEANIATHYNLFSVDELLELECGTGYHWEERGSPSYGKSRSCYRDARSQTLLHERD